jgi:putative ABC transport system ATP-binding protein
MEFVNSTDVEARTEGLARPAVAVTDLRFKWSDLGEPIIDLPRVTVNSGERLFVGGPSGCGKSTLLSLLAGITTPQEGVVALLGQEFSQMSAAKRDSFRADHIGYIFQMFNLVPYLSVVENVTLPLRFSKCRLAKASTSGEVNDEAIRLLAHLGLSGDGLLDRSVSELSVGQQQRVAAARALIGSPEILIADEPTSSLDAANREAFISLLFEECSNTKAALVFVSHDESLAPLFDRSVILNGVAP